MHKIMNNTLAILLLIISINSYACNNPKYKASPLNTEYVSTPDSPRTRTIVGPVSIEQAEEKHTYAPAGENIAEPFGSHNNKWEAFKKLYTPGDQLYFVKKESKTECCDNYLEKYIIVREDCVISKYLVRSNGIVEGK